MLRTDGSVDPRTFIPIGDEDKDSLDEGGKGYGSDDEDSLTRGKTCDENKVKYFS